MANYKKGNICGACSSNRTGEINDAIRLHHSLQVDERNTSEGDFDPLGFSEEDFLGYCPGDQ